MTTSNGNGGDLKGQLALLQTENRRLEAKCDELRNEVEWLKKMSIHNQEGWYSPFDPEARANG